MRKLAVTVAAAIAVVGAGASTASAATTVAKPTTHGAWNWNSEKTAKQPKLKDIHTWGTWSWGTKPHKKGKWLTINGKVADVTKGHDYEAVVNIFKGSTKIKPRQFFADTAKAAPIRLTYKATTKPKIWVQKCILGTEGTQPICGAQHPLTFKK